MIFGFSYWGKPCSLVSSELSMNWEKWSQKSLPNTIWAAKIILGKYIFWKGPWQWKFNPENVLQLIILFYQLCRVFMNIWDSTQSLGSISWEHPEALDKQQKECIISQAMHLPFMLSSSCPSYSFTLTHQANFGTDVKQVVLNSEGRPQRYAVPSIPEWSEICRKHLMSFCTCFHSSNALVLWIRSFLFSSLQALNL